MAYNQVKNINIGNTTVIILYTICFLTIFGKNFTDTKAETGLFPQVGIEQSEKRFITSEIMGEKYAIDVWLPRGYTKNLKHQYPIIYLTDSELNFPVVSFIMGRLIKNKDMPPAILVGISHNTTYKDWYYIKRARDFTPVKRNHKDFPKTGGAKNFTKMIKNEIFPFIEKNYRVDPTNKTLVGMSLGGLYAHYVMFNFPDLFNRFLIVSPSVWYGEKFLIKDEERFSKQHQELQAKIYTAVGSKEPKHFVQDWTQLNNNMKSRKYQGLELKTKLLKGEDHRSISPRAFTNGFKYLFRTSDTMK